MKESKAVSETLKAKSILVEAPIILVGGTPKSFVVKAVLDQMGYKKVRICEYKSDQYKAKIALKAEAAVDKVKTDTPDNG